MRIILLFVFLLLVSTIRSDEQEAHITQNGNNKYKVNVWVCDPLDLEKKPTENAPDRSLPKKIAMPIFHQGDLVTMCVAVNRRAARDGVVIAKLMEFVWVGLDVDVQQRAIDEGKPATNELTSFNPTSSSLNCTSVDWCSFTSILDAGFFLASGTVRGLGYAELEMERRLGVLKPNNEEYWRLTDDQVTPFVFFETLILVDSGDTIESTDDTPNTLTGFSETTEEMQNNWMSFLTGDTGESTEDTRKFLGVSLSTLIPMILIFVVGGLLLAIKVCLYYRR